MRNNFNKRNPVPNYTFNNPPKNKTLVINKE